MGQELIEEHVERHIGPIAGVFHELVEPDRPSAVRPKTKRFGPF